MRGPLRSARVLGAMATVAGALLAAACHAEPDGSDPRFRFERVYVDTEYGASGKPGWVRAGDLDGDGDVDVVAGGGRALYVYENLEGAAPWRRHGNLDATESIGGNGAVLLDVDRDGDRDVVCARFFGPLTWWENPGNLGPPWRSHEAAEESWFLHDLIAADVDGDARGELVANFISKGIEAKLRVKWYRPGPDPSLPWVEGVIEPGRDDGRNNHAGLDLGDVDRDGRADLAYSNGWYRAPEHPGGAWTWHPVTDVYGLSNALLRDVDRDGRLDLIASAGHHGRGIFWFQAPADPRRPEWRRHPIAPDLLHPECLGAADLDADGDLDLVSCDLDFERWDQEVHRVYVFEALGGGWRRRPVTPPSYPAHLLQLVDVDSDGRLDVVSEATGHSVVTLLWNRTPAGPIGPGPSP